MKISKTQAEILEKAKNTIEILRKYKNFTDFFDNSRNEQITFSTAASYNCAWNSSELWRAKDPKRWAEMEKDYIDAVNEQIIIVAAKTESVHALERAGLIKILEEAKCNGGYETIKIL